MTALGDDTSREWTYAVGHGEVVYRCDVAECTDPARWFLVYVGRKHGNPDNTHQRHVAHLCGPHAEEMARAMGARPHGAM